jgi:hypothetical protein
VFCEIVQLFSFVFCVVRAVHKLDFRLVTNEKTNVDHWIAGRVVIPFLKRSICFPQRSLWVSMGPNHTVQINYILWITSCYQAT